MKPMLAKKFNPSRVVYPCYLQPKLDGVRAIAVPGQPTMQSRPKPPDYDHIHWNHGILGAIEAEVLELQQAFPSFVFDGELYNHQLSLQQINSIVAVKRTTPSPDLWKIDYYIFDLVDTTNPYLPFEARFYHLTELADYVNHAFDNIRVVESVYCTNESFADKYFKLSIREGYEGIMYRDPTMPYARDVNKENRVWWLQKRKYRQDLDTVIVGLLPGEGKHEGRLGALQVQDSSGRTFNVGTGLTDSDREYYWANPDKVLGATLTVEFRKLSDSSVPLEPVVKYIDFDS